MLEYLSMAQSAVRRINYRLEVLMSKVGVASPIYQKEASRITASFPENYRYKEGGMIQLYNPAELYNDEKMNERLENIDRTFKKWGDIKNEYVEKYEQYKKSFARDVSEGFRTEDEFVTFQQFIEANLTLGDALSWHYEHRGEESTEIALEIMHQKGRLKLYTELNEVISRAQDKGAFAYGNV